MNIVDKIDAVIEAVKNSENSENEFKILNQNFANKIGKQLVWDYDYIKYSIGAACEKRDILVTHPSGIEEVFKTRTEFYGHWKKKEGGWLAEYNKSAKNKLTPDDFTIQDRQHPEPLEFCLSSVKNHIYNICEHLDVDNYKGYIGRGDSWRVEASTILKYKGQRANMLKPIHLKAIEEYLISRHDAEVVEVLESDDKCVMECYKNPENILIFIDKDYYGVNNLIGYNVNTKEIVNTGNGLGFLKSTSKGVKGEGRKFFYHQILSGDASDNYFANSASDVKWAEMSSYNALKDCKTDRECWQAIVDSYKILYPTPKVITGWRGDEIEIDWLYVLQENATMAHMLRKEDDRFSVKDVLAKLEIV